MADFDFESRLASLLLGYAKSRGLDAEALATRFSVPLCVLSETPGKVTLVSRVSTLVALTDALALELNDPHVGLSIAAWIPRGSYGVAEFLMRAGPTLRDVIANLVRFTAIITPSQRFRSEELDGEARVFHGPLLSSGAMGRHLEEYTSAILIRTVVELLGLRVLRAWFVHRQSDSSSFERLHAGLHTSDLRYGEASNGFALDAAQLDAAVAGGDPALSGFLEELAMRELALRPVSDGLVAQLRVQVRDAIKHGEPNIERVAERMGLSGRTLQRKLSDEGTGFQQVLDEVRFELARSYLNDPRFDLSQIAFLLGYSELRAFDRAFRRWANVAPSEWRK